MSDKAEKGMYCCSPPKPGRRMLTFPDGTQVGVMGLDEILADMHAGGRQVGADTAEEIVERLSENNYVAPSFRHEYCEVVLDEYRRFVLSRTDANR